MTPAGDITRLIDKWQHGDHSAEQALFDALYRALHNIALQILRTEKKSQSLGATALVHEAYVRFSGIQGLSIVNRTHFLALAARVMRRVLVDRARARQCEKRGREPVPVELTDSLVRTDRDADQILAIDQALENLCLQSPRQGRLVELRYFAGYTLEESALILGVSPRTARREWQIARTRLRGAIDGTASPD